MVAEKAVGSPYLLTVERFQLWLMSELWLTSPEMRGSNAISIRWLVVARRLLSHLSLSHQVLSTPHNEPCQNERVLRGGGILLRTPLALVVMISELYSHDW